ncbi:MAG: 2-C-methyl-D-erythritol 2,4-cyclodiphosphate synthase [Clostridiales bacterium]|nr:2-C-methyl-D-erythritol 2,4-cyclodiphosphate synthase [Clostridiales bacterium]
MSRAAAVLLCAGGSTRMGFDKLLTPIAGKTAIERSLDALVLGGAEEIVFAVSPATRAFVEALACPVPRQIVEGGETRAQSVRNALNVLSNADIVAIHDAARCMVSPETVKESIESAEQFGSGVVAGRVTDTIMRLEGGDVIPLDRSKLIRMQTPQTFRFDRIRQAYDKGDLGAVTDDCALYIAAGYEPRFVYTEGEAANQKLTTGADWQLALASYARFGTGYDTHRLVEGRKLILGGVELPFEKGLLGHSDADVLTHAIMDALLGAAGLGDIGRLFPDTDVAYRDADSVSLLREVVRQIEQTGLRVGHVDATVIAERPKIKPHADAMRARLSEAMHVFPESVSIKATTTEGMNDEGKGLCISASAVVSLV